MRLTVIVCTSNPRRDYLERTLGGLRAQTLPSADWDLIIVDNHSAPPIATWLHPAGHPCARIVDEDTPGYTPALMRGLREPCGDVCVLVHDDNILAPDYLAEVARIAREWPRLGAWGGHYDVEYERPPDAALAPFIAYLAVNPIQRDRWSNTLYDYGATPCGAGMAVRTDVLRRWVDLVTTDPRRRSLGRHTDKLTSCEDFDIAFTAIDLGYGTGVFTCLKVRHLIPTRRVERSYLERLVEGHGYSSVLLHSFRGTPAQPSRGPIARLRRWRYLRTLAPMERAVQEALARGERRAFAALAPSN